MKKKKTTNKSELVGGTPAMPVGASSCSSWDLVVVLVYNFCIINDFFTDIRVSCLL